MSYIQTNWSWVITPLKQLSTWFPAQRNRFRSLLGVRIIYWRFVPKFVQIAAPLNRNLKEGEPWALETRTQEGHDKSETLQGEWISAPVLPLPRSNGRRTLDTDACNNENVYVLMQEQPEGTIKTLKNWSRTLNAAEQNYDVTHRECLAVVGLFCYYISIWMVMNSPFVLITLRWNISLTGQSPLTNRRVGAYACSN